MLNQKDIDEVARVIHSSIGWAATKDRDLLFNSLVQNSSLFIFHPDSDSTIRGFEQFRDHAERVFMNDAFRAISYEIKELNINLSRDRSVAWYSAILDDIGEWNGRSVEWKDVRWTGVLEKLESRWVIVQMHFSFSAAG